ncbi:MAG: hypothetical protein ACJA13_002704 [Paraglaciecola sp.]|jgi:hypothetical protein
MTQDNRGLKIGEGGLTILPDSNEPPKQLAKKPGGGALIWIIKGCFFTPSLKKYYIKFPAFRKRL